MSRFRFNVAVLVNRIGFRLLPRLFDGFHRHDHRVHDLSIVIEHDRVHPDNRLIHRIKRLFMNGDELTAAVRFERKLFTLMDYLSRDIFEIRNNAFSDCHRTHIGTNERQLIVVRNEVALLLRRIKTLNDHIEDRVCDAAFRAFLEYVHFFNRINHEPCGLNRIRHTVIGGQVNLPLTVHLLKSLVDIRLDLHFDFFRYDCIFSYLFCCHFLLLLFITNVRANHL